MQADQLAQFRKPDAFAVTRDLLEDREGAAERLDADPLPIIGVVVDIGLRRLHQPGDRGLAWTGRLLAGLWFGTRSHGSGLHADDAELYQAVLGSEQHGHRIMRLRRGCHVRAYHNIN